MYLKLFIIFFLVALSGGRMLAQQPFTAGNIVVYRAGDGTVALSDKAAPVFLDEYTPAGVLVQSIAMPTAPNGAQHRLTCKGNDQDGLLTLSSDGRYLVVPGANAVVGTSPGGTAGVIGLVDFNARVNTSTAISGYRAFPGGFSMGGVASDDGNRIWFGKYSEVRYTTAGSTTSTIVGTSGSYMSGFSIADGQLYVGLESSNARVCKVGTGLPVTSGQTVAGIPGFVLASARSPKQYAFADLDASVPGVDVLYVADGNNTDGGVRKFSLVNGSWVSNGQVGVPADQYVGITVRVSGNITTLFATRQGSNTGAIWGGELVKMTDNSGYNGAFTATPVALASVVIPNSMSFRGVALVPQGCQPVLKLAAADVTAFQSTITWQPPLAGGSKFEYAVTQDETPPVAGTVTNNLSETVSGLSNEVNYFAHVRTICNALSRSVWSTIPFKTGCNAPAVTAITTDVSSTGLATIRWNSVLGAASYEYILSKAAITPNIGTSINNPFLTVSVDAVSKYYVYVRSNCGNGAFSPWVSASFSTNCLQPDLTKTILPDKVAVSWSRINNASRYEYALTKGAATPLSGTMTTDTIFQVSKLQQGAGYYFHCRSVCNTGIQSAWSTVSFDTEGMEIFPNPVRSTFSIILHGPKGSHPQVTISNAQGKRIHQWEYSGKATQVNAHFWQAGIYFVQYQDEGHKYVLKLMKTN